MGIKTDYLKDCFTGEKITIKELLDLKTSTISDDFLEEKIDEINNNLKNFEEKIISENNEFKKEINDTIEELNKRVTKFENFIKNYFNVLDIFKRFKIEKIIRNEFNLIEKIIFKNNFYIKINYFINDDIFIFPNKFNYYDDEDNLLGFEEITIKNNSIVGFEPQIVKNILDLKIFEGEI